MPHPRTYPKYYSTKNLDEDSAGPETPLSWADTESVGSLAALDADRNVTYDEEGNWDEGVKAGEGKDGQDPKKGEEEEDGEEE